MSTLLHPYIVTKETEMAEPLDFNRRSRLKHVDKTFRAAITNIIDLTDHEKLFHVRIVEVYNGGSRGSEDELAQAMADRLGYQGVGGSDAHVVSHIGRCATRFPGPVRSEAELVEALKAGEFEAMSWKSKS